VDKEVIDGSELRQLLEDNYPGPKLVPGSLAIADSAGDEEEEPLPDTGVREQTGN
jgi:hypothetical protein